MKKFTKFLLIFVIIVLTAFIISIFLFDNRDIFLMFFVNICLLSGLVFIILLFKKKWRQNLFIPIATGLACFASAIIIDGMTPIHFKRNPERTQKEAIKTIISNSGKNFEIVSCSQDENDHLTYTYVLNNKDCLPSADNNKDFKEVLGIDENTALVKISVTGKWNEDYYIESLNLKDIPYSGRQLKILEKGGFFEYGDSTIRKRTDSVLLDADWDGYFEFLRNTISKFLFTVDFTNVSYYGTTWHISGDLGNLITDPWFREINEKGFTNPKIVFWINDDINTRKVITLNGTINSNKNLYFSEEIDFGKNSLDGKIFYRIVAQEVFDNDWLENVLYYLDDDFLYWDWYTRGCYETGRRLFPKSTYMAILEGQIKGTSENRNLTEKKKNEMIESLKKTMKEVEYDIYILDLLK